MIQPAKLLRTAVLTVALSALCVVGASAASLGVGTVASDGLRLREEATTNSIILDTASKGDTVVLLEDAGNNWYKVDYKTTVGYMSGDYLTISQKADVKIGYGKVSAEGATLNVRSGPGTEYDRVCVLASDAIVSIVGIDNGWYKVYHESGVDGYVSSDFMTICKESSVSRSTSGSSSSSSSSASAAPAAASSSSGSLGQQVAAYAQQFLGVPYVYGGNGPSCFDCSGFTSYVYRHFGYTINRTASTQLSNGYSVSKSELQPGDLVFFRYNTSYPASHVGIYIGGGQFIHASTNSYRVRIDTLTSGHYCNVYIGARRIF